MLRQLRAPHGRAKRGLFVAEGERMCRSLLEAGAMPQKIFVVQRFAGAFPNDLPIEVVSPRAMEQASELSSAPGVVGIFCAPPKKDFRFECRFTLALDAIQNPGNLGTIVRTADWFGIDQLLCSPDCADLYAPKTLQATMGAIAHVAARYEPLEVALDALPSGFPIMALDMHGEPLGSFRPPAQGIILVGSEGRGLSPMLRQRATAIIAIPPIGTPAVDSLNAAVAAAIVLAHLRQ